MKTDETNKTYPKASHTVDIALCRIHNEELEVLLIKRGQDPYKNKYALVGGFVDIEKNEGLLDAAKRELLEETNIKFSDLNQLKTYGDDAHRDPRERVITTVYYGFITPDKYKSAKAGDDASQLEWAPLKKVKQLAFDHKIILKDLEKEISLQILYGTAAFSLVPKKFTWSQLRSVYEIILGKKLIAQNFPRDIKRDYEVIELAETMSIGRGKPARLIQLKKLRKKF